MHLSKRKWLEPIMHPVIIRKSTLEKGLIAHGKQKLFQQIIQKRLKTEFSSNQHIIILKENEKLKNSCKTSLKLDDKSNSKKY